MSFRILHVFDHSVPLHSGYTFRSLAILRQQHALGWTTEHLTSTKHPFDGQLEEVAEGLHFFRCPPSSGLLARLPLLNQWAVVKDLERRLEPLARQWKPDVLHAHSPALNGLAAVNVGRRLGIPVVYEVRAFWEDAAVDHGTTSEGSLRYRLGRALESMVLRRADAVMTIALGLKEDMIGRGIAADKITMIPNAVDLSRFDALPPPDADLRSSLGLDGRQVMAFIGSFYGYEGLSMAVDALDRLRERMPDLDLLLVGGGFQEEALKAQVARLGLEQRVHFVGRVPHEQVAAYYALAEVMVYPRLAMRLTETVTPLKPLEAMSQRRLVVASDVGGHRELIEDGRTGWLFKADDVAALADTLERVFADRAAWSAVQDAGRAFVENERSWRVIAARYQPVYQALVGA